MSGLYKTRFDELLTQLDAVFATTKTTYDPYSRQNETDLDSNTLLEWRVKAKNLLLKVCGDDSEHYKAFVEEESPSGYSTYLSAAKRVKAVFLAAKEDFDTGMLRSSRSIVQAELFSSELDQARELHSHGYISAAAVITGVVLETTLRELCDREGIPYGKLDKMNADLAKKGVYNVLV